MQNPIPKFRQNSIISEKSGYLSEKLKAWTCSNYHRVQYFFVEILLTFPTYQCSPKAFRDFVLIKTLLIKSY